MSNTLEQKRNYYQNLLAHENIRIRDEIDKLEAYELESQDLARKMMGCRERIRTAHGQLMSINELWQHYIEDQDGD